MSMIGKLIGVVAALSLLSFSLGFLYQNLPQTPVAMVVNTTGTKPTQIINYSATPVFAKNLRFNHNNISYSIESSCSEIRAVAMREAFQVFEEKMGIIHFKEVYNDGADIIVKCPNEIIKLNKGFFTAGEGGPSKMINTSYFEVIQKGKIFLYKDPRCKRPVVEIHELLHVFGFNHSLNPENIMYNVSNCDQKITPDIIKLINELYSIKPLPDTKISKISATERGRYLDFNISVLNDGLIGIKNINLTLIAEGKKVDVIPLGEIGIGYSRTLRAKNIKLPYRGIKKIAFVLDYESTIKELNEDNNRVQMILPTS